MRQLPFPVELISNAPKQEKQKQKTFEKLISGLKPDGPSGFERAAV